MNPEPSDLGNVVKDLVLASNQPISSLPPEELTEAGIQQALETANMGINVTVKRCLPDLTISEGALTYRKDNITQLETMARELTPNTILFQLGAFGKTADDFTKTGPVWDQLSDPEKAALHRGFGECYDPLSLSALTKALKYFRESADELIKEYPFLKKLFDEDKTILFEVTKEGVYEVDRETEKAVHVKIAHKDIIRLDEELTKLRFIHPHDNDPQHGMRQTSESLLQVVRYDPKVSQHYMRGYLQILRHDPKHSPFVHFPLLKREVEVNIQTDGYRNQVNGTLTTIDTALTTLVLDHDQGQHIASYKAVFGLTSSLIALVEVLRTDPLDMNVKADAICQYIVGLNSRLGGVLAEYAKKADPKDTDAVFVEYFLQKTKEALVSIATLVRTVANETRGNLLADGAHAQVFRIELDPQLLHYASQIGPHFDPRYIDVPRQIEKSLKTLQREITNCIGKNQAKYIGDGNNDGN